MDWLLKVLLGWGLADDQDAEPANVNRAEAEDWSRRREIAVNMAEEGRRESRRHPDEYRRHFYGSPDDEW